MSENKQVFEVISIFTLGINMSSANYVNMIFNESSKNVITVDNIAMGYDVVKIGDDLYQVNLNLGSAYIDSSGVNILELTMTQSGVFRIIAGEESPDDYIQMALYVNAPSILYPHLRPLYNMIVAQNGIKPHPLGTFDFYDSYIKNGLSKNDQIKESLRTGESVD